jgi:hypothetical protein
MMFKIPVRGGEVRISASTSADCSGARAAEHVGVFLSTLDVRGPLTPGEARAIAAALATCAGEVDLRDGPARGAAR